MSSYVIALLKLMDDLPRRQGKSKDILDLFGEHYSDEIAPTHHRKNSSGRVQWIVRTQWARQKAVNLGLMDSPARGVWHLTEEGHRWLAEHPKATRLEDVDLRDSGADRSAITDGASLGKHKYHLYLSETVLEQFLPAELPNLETRLVNRNDRLYIKIRTVQKCHYEIRIHSDYHEIALHFQNNNPSRNQALLRVFEPHLKSITGKIEQKVQALANGESGDFSFLLDSKYDWSVHAEAWGSANKWTRVWIKLPNDPPSPNLFMVYGVIALTLIAETWPIFKPAYESIRKGIAPPGKIEKTDGRYEILDHQIEAIHTFLQGRSDLRPSDEKLCDWVNFCYTFELFKEGMDLFRIVLAENVDSWYLDRTRKLARICEMRARG